MVLRSKPLLVIAASLFVLFQGDFTQAQGKSHGAARATERTKPKSAGSSRASGHASAATPPATPTVKPVPVCVRPKGIDKKVEKWTYSETNKPVVTDVEGTALRLHNRIYVFDKKANIDSPKSLPAPDNKSKCPADKRKDEPAAPKPAGILPPSGPMFTATAPLGPSNGFLASSSLGSSGTGKSATALVNQFVQKAAQFHVKGNPDALQATQFAQKLRDSISNKTPMAEIPVGDLSLNAATVLANEFGESLAAAMAQQSVVGPLNVLQKMVPSGKKPGWNVFALVNKQWMADREVIAPDEVPTVMLSIADHQQRTNALASRVPGEIPAKILHIAYKQAYADKPAWLTSIAPYFN